MHKYIYFEIRRRSGSRKDITWPDTKVSPTKRSIASDIPLLSFTSIDDILHKSNSPTVVLHKAIYCKQIPCQMNTCSS